MRNNRKFVQIALLTAAVILTAGCSIEAPRVTGYAVVYGISLYDPDFAEGEPNTLNLTYSNDDAVAVAAMFEDADYNVILRTDTQATPENLLLDTEYVSGRISPEENFVFYFSGHGVGSNILPTEEDSPEPAGRDRYDEWIFLYGSIDNGTIADKNAALRDDDLLALIERVNTTKRVVILDACNSGGFIGSEAEIDLVPQNSNSGEEASFADAVQKYFSNTVSDPADIPASKALVLTAAGEQEDTYETSELEHGIFTYYLLHAPFEADANTDGFVTAGECFNYASLMIERQWAFFKPRISGGPVDFVLFRTRE